MRQGMAARFFFPGAFGATAMAAKKTTMAKIRAKVDARAPVRVTPDVTALIAVLQAHALGEHEMTASQVTVALSLLKIFTGRAAAEDEKGISHEDALAALA
jgi:hypothetical protein